MLISETYKKRLQELAGLRHKTEEQLEVISEVTNQERENAFSLSGQRIPYQKDLMIQAINEGREVGILFQSNNSSYRMKVGKYRIIFPVCLGTSKAGNQVVRAVHKIGQSESAALRTGKRSQEVEDEWRMFKVSNIKSFWFTGKFFSIPPKHYNAADKGMVNVEVAANFDEIQKYQAELIETMRKQEKPKPNIVSLFKEPEQPVQEPNQTDAVMEPKPKKLKGTIAPKTTIPISPVVKKIATPLSKPYKKRLNELAGLTEFANGYNVIEIRSKIDKSFKFDIVSDNNNKIFKVESQGDVSDKMKDKSWLDLFINFTTNKILDYDLLRDTLSKIHELYVADIK